MFLRSLKKYSFSLFILLIISGNSLCFAKDQSVILLELDWSSQKVLTHALYSLLVEQGVKSRIKQSPASGQWFYLTKGKADVQIEVWEGTMAKELHRLLKQNRVAIGTTHKVKSREGWWYPLFVESLCPGLPDWKALLSCSNLFSVEGGKGVYYSGPWEKPDAARIRALNLPFDLVSLDSGAQLDAVLLEAIKNRKPIIRFSWSPNWIDKAFEGRFVNFPQYSEECETNAKWGVNPRYPWDCDNPIDGWLKTITSSHLKEKSLCASEIIKSFVLNNDDLAYASFLIDSEGLSVEKAAKVWLEYNVNRHSTWVSHPECLNNISKELL